MTPALQAAVGLEALAMFRQLELGCAINASELCNRLGVARSYAYEQRDRLRSSLERDPTTRPCETCGNHERAVRRNRITITVLEYRAAHPGAWVEGRRTVYSDGLRKLVVSLAEANADLEQAELADACRIPLATFKQWRAQGPTNTNAASATRLDANAPSANPNAASATPRDENAQSANAVPAVPRDAKAPSANPNAASATPRDANAPSANPNADTDATTAEPTMFSYEMLRILREYERWDGSLPAFVDHLRELGLHWGREHVTQLLLLAAARALLRRPPPKPPARGSSFRPPPGVQWTTDGKQVSVVIDGQTHEVAWQPMVDVGSTATVGAAVRANEDTPGVVAAFNEGIATTGDVPRALLVDNKAPNKSEALRDALPDETMLMHATPARPPNKAVVEGMFGLFAQDLAGSVIAVVDTSTPAQIALAVAEAVTRAYTTGRNHRPRRKDGKTPYELYRDRDRSPEAIAAAVKILRAIKDRIDQRAAREAAGRDPRVLAAFEGACTRFGFEDDGDLRVSLNRIGIESIEQAIAIYATKLRAGSLPVDADNLRYFMGIARHCQGDRELLYFEQELVGQLERRAQITLAYLERRAAEFAHLDVASRMRAIVDETLTASPIAQHFWRRCLIAVSEIVPVERRADVRRTVCERIRRCYAATKQLRHSLVDLVVRLLVPDAVLTS
jgi:hypothetical protein